ncbi:MAG: hypothetical protein H0T59_00625 [Chloroflexi bacterium]|nr:hypothetical protein [Chloroflexota bacterium]
MTAAVSVKLTPASDADAQLWRLTREVANLLDSLPWVLVGGQMVAILEAEQEATIGFATGDVDTLIDVRAMVGIAKEATKRLLDAGFEPDTEGARGYRFVRGDSIVDLLAPDHLGPRADLRTVPPDSTVEIAGGSQALARARTAELDTGDGPFEVRIPTLAGGVVIKARAAATAQEGRAKHERDLARLLALVPDVSELRAELTDSERGYLRKHAALVDIAHPAWQMVVGAEDGVAALAFLIATG